MTCHWQLHQLILIDQLEAPISSQSGNGLTSCIEIASAHIYQPMTGLGAICIRANEKTKSTLTNDSIASHFEIESGSIHEPIRANHLVRADAILKSDMCHHLIGQLV